MLIKCHECLKEISDKASSCPYCGYPMNEPLVSYQLQVYTVEDIRKILNIGRRQAYELVNSGKFPARRMGRKILVSKKVFEDWLNNETNNN